MWLNRATTASASEPGNQRFSKHKQWVPGLQMTARPAVNIHHQNTAGGSSNGCEDSERRSDDSGSSSKASEAFGVEPKFGGWNFLFDLRERDTEWTEENKARLMAIVTAQHMGISMTDMEDRLDALMKLLPDLAGRLPQLHPSLLGGLVKDLADTTHKMLLLKHLLPAANVSRVVAERPQLLLLDSREITESVKQLKTILNMDRVDKLVEAQPLLLVTECVEEVLSDIRRLMPGFDAVSVLSGDPDWVLRVQRGQKWLGQHPDSDAGELITWTPPDSRDISNSGGSGSSSTSS